MQICVGALTKGWKPSGIHLEIRLQKSLTASFMEQSPDTELNPALDRLPFPTTQYVYMHSLIAFCLKFHFGVSSEFLSQFKRVGENSVISLNLVLLSTRWRYASCQRLLRPLSSRSFTPHDKLLWGSSLNQKHP